MAAKNNEALKRYAILGVVIIVVFAAVAFALRQSGDEGESTLSSSENQGIEVGQKVPELRAKDLDEKEFVYPGKSEKPVWLIFNATWCSACRAEIPEIKKAVAASDVEVISVYLNESQPQVKQYADKLELTHTQLPDPSGALARSYFAVSVPTHFFIDREGTVVAKHIGAMGQAQIDQALKKLRETK